MNEKSGEDGKEEAVMGYVANELVERGDDQTAERAGEYGWDGDGDGEVCGLRASL